MLSDRPCSSKPFTWSRESCFTTSYLNLSFIIYQTLMQYWASFMNIPQRLNVARMTVKFKIKCFNIYNVVIVLFGSDLCLCLLKSVQQISACVSQWQSHSHWVRTRDCLYIRLCESVWYVIAAIFTHYYQWIWAHIYQSAGKGTHSVQKNSYFWLN